MAANRTSVPRAQRTNPFAIAALVCGIVQFCGAFPAGIVAIFLGHKALRQIRQTGEDGYGMAKAGLILGYLGLSLALFTVLLMLAMDHAAPGPPGPPGAP